MPKTPPHPHFQAKELDRLRKLCARQEYQLGRTKGNLTHANEAICSYLEENHRLCRTIQALCTGEHDSESLGVIALIMGDNYRPPTN